MEQIIVVGKLNFGRSGMKKIFKKVENCATAAQEPENQPSGRGRFSGFGIVFLENSEQ
ncbi:MAG: hypothetical protein NWR72_08830 [Bacteroidia bacterium]|nr:hypothetical protein [Bacteroidia bacterium]